MTIIPYGRKDALPPFPADVPTHPLLVIDYALIRAGDEREHDRLWKAATELGFWYLKNHGLDTEAEEMFEVGKGFMGLSLEEKMAYEQGDSGYSFGYKAAGENVTNEAGTPDTVEFLNISADDALAYPTPVHMTYPPAVSTHMERVITPFVEKARGVAERILTVFEGRLDAPEGEKTLRDVHEGGTSGSEARWIRNPPQTEKYKLALGAHTDFGSLSVLFNRLGGLQVLAPGSEEWQYVKPMPGYAICNVGDALKILSGGVLHSNVHRVVPPPGEQARHERWSVVYFHRPTDDTPLRPLGSLANNKCAELVTGATAGEWFARRVKYHRTRNFKEDSEGYKKSRGTEYKEV